MLNYHNILLCQETSARYLSTHLGSDPEYWHRYLDKDRRRMRWNREFFRCFHRRPSRILHGHWYYAHGNLSQYVVVKNAGAGFGQKVSGDAWSSYVKSLNPFTCVGTEFSLGGELQVLQYECCSKTIKPDMAKTLATDLIVKADLCDKYIFDYDKWEVVEKELVPTESNLMKLLAAKQQSMRREGRV